MDEKTIRFATREDSALVLTFIKELAEYEKLLHEVVASEEGLAEQLFGAKPYAEVIIAEYEGQAAGFALFTHKFSTFLGKPTIYLEDIYVKPEQRGKGLGKEMLSFIAKLAIARDCGRMEWWVLDWNKPSIDFYKNLDAEAMDEWTVFRLSGDKLTALAEEQ